MIVTLDSHLPQRGIAREERGIAAARDESFDRVTHAARPILVVADGQVQTRAIQHLGMLFEISVRADADLEPLAFGPFDERQLPVGPTRRPGIARQMVDLDVADVCGVLRIGRARPRHPSALARRFVEVARRHRPLHGDVGATGVEVRPAKVVVGVPGVGRQRHHDACTGRWTHNEEREVTAHLLADVDLHHDLVVARPPRLVDVQRESNGPSAPGRGGAFRRLMLFGCDRVRPEDDVPVRADPCHLYAHWPARRRRNVQANRRAPRHRLRPAIPGDHFAVHLRTLTASDQPSFSTVTEG